MNEYSQLRANDGRHIWIAINLELFLHWIHYA